MKKIYFLLVVLTPFFSLPLLAQLDNVFGTGGRALATLGTSSDGRAMLIQPADQKIVVAGVTSDGTNSYFAVARFTDSGALDPKFGTGGKIQIPVAAIALEGPSIAIQSNGSIILAGVLIVSNGMSRYGILIRLTSLGQVDFSFSPTGYIQLANVGEAFSVLVQTDDKIVVGGYGGTNYPNTFCVARYSKDGVLDTGFGSGGMVTVYAGNVYAMAFESDGSIIATGLGYGGNTIATIHLSTKGVLDTHFGTNGISTVTVNGNDPVQVRGVTVLDNGFIVLTGYYFPAVTNPTWRYLLVELRGDGTLNPGFAGNGKLAVPCPNYNAYGYGAVQLSGGQLVAVGFLEPTNNGPFRVGLCRVTANGAIDYSFGANGFEITAWSNSSYNVTGYSIALQKDQKIVVGGGLNGGGIIALRYLNPVIIPPPPVVTTVPAALQGVTLTPTDADLRLFPNPAGQTLNVQGLDPSASTLLQVTDVSGRTLLTVRSANETLVPLDIYQLPAGTYFLTLLTDTHRKTLTFVKKR
jgi:uncharacterized delta-60 repeat protein